MTTSPKTRTRNVPAAGKPSHDQPPAAGAPSKLDRIVALLGRPEGASLAEMIAATDWQAHSVRGALAGALKKKGHEILSEKTDGVRRYRVKAAR
jgi:hypothetical protein